MIVSMNGEVDSSRLMFSRESYIGVKENRLAQYRSARTTEPPQAECLLRKSDFTPTPELKAG